MSSFRLLAYSDDRIFIAEPPAGGCCSLSNVDDGDVGLPVDVL